MIFSAHKFSWFQNNWNCWKCLKGELFIRGCLLPFTGRVDVSSWRLCWVSVFDVVCALLDLGMLIRIRQCVFLRASCILSISVKVAIALLRFYLLNIYEVNGNSVGINWICIKTWLCNSVCEWVFSSLSVLRTWTRPFSIMVRILFTYHNR